MANCKKSEITLEEQKRYLEYLREQLADKKHDILEHRKNVAEIKRLASKTKNISTNGYKYDIDRLNKEIALDMKIQNKYKRDIISTERKIKKMRAKCKEFY